MNARLKLWGRLALAFGALLALLVRGVQALLSSPATAGRQTGNEAALPSSPQAIALPA